MTIAHAAHPSTREERAEHWRAIRERSTRGMLLFNSGPDFAHLEGDFWAVRSSQGGWWKVDLEEEACDCPDFEYFGSKHGIPCKHVFALAVARAARRSGVREVREVRVVAGDPFKAAQLARHLDSLEDQLAHELLGDAERQELRDRVLRLRRRLGR